MSVVMSIYSHQDGTLRLKVLKNAMSKVDNTWARDHAERRLVLLALAMDIMVTLSLLLSTTALWVLMTAIIPSLLLSIAIAN